MSEPNLITFSLDDEFKDLPNLGNENYLLKLIDANSYQLQLLKTQITILEQSIQTIIDKINELTTVINQL